MYDKPLGKLDALLIEPQPAIFPTVNQFNPPSIVGVGDAVELELPSQGSLVAASVIEICPLPTVPLSKTPPNLMAVQVFVDQHGVAGDSGSLIVDKTSSTGMAIYTGELDLTSMGGIIEGVGQYLGQVAEAMNIELLAE